MYVYDVTCIWLNGLVNWLNSLKSYVYPFNIKTESGFPTLNQRMEARRKDTKTRSLTQKIC